MFLNVAQPPFDDVRVRRGAELRDRPRARRGARGRRASSPCRRARSCRVAFPAHEPYCPYTRLRDRTCARLRAQHRCGLRHARASGSSCAPRSASRRGRYFAGLLDDLGFRASLRVLEPGPTTSTGPGPAGRDAQIGFEGWSADYLSPSTFSHRTSRAPPRRSAPATTPRTRLRPSACQARRPRARCPRRATPPPRWTAADRYVVDQAFAVPLTNHRAAVLVSERVGNVQSHLQWFTLLDQLWVR